MPQPREHGSTRRVSAVLAAALLAGVFAVIYTASASHTVIFDDVDAAEFQTIGVVGGIPHQPYPLWCVIAKAFTLLPLGEPAFRVTLLSILFASLALALLFLVIERRTGSFAAAACGAAALGFSLTYWRYAIVAEFYPLAVFLLVGLIYLADQIVSSRTARLSCALAFTAALLVSQQTLNVAMLPALFLFYWRSGPVTWRTLGRRGAAMHAAAVLLPFTTYLYTFLVARGPFPMNWLDIRGKYFAEAQGIAWDDQGFLQHLLFQLWVGRLNPDVPSLDEFARTAVTWLRHAGTFEFPLVGSVLVVVGFVSMWKKDRRANVFLVCLCAPYLILALSKIGETYAYTIPVLVVFSLWLAEGFVWLRARSFWPRRMRAPLFACVAAAVVVLPVIRQADPSALKRRLQEPRAGLKAEDRGMFPHLVSRNDRGMLYGERIGEVVGPGSAVLGAWRETNVLWYHKLVLGGLDGVEVAYLPPERSQTRAIVESLGPVRVFTTFHPDSVGLTGFRVEKSMEIISGRRLFALLPPE